MCILKRGSRVGLLAIPEIAKGDIGANIAFVASVVQSAALSIKKVDKCRSIRATEIVIHLANHLYGNGPQREIQMWEKSENS